MSDQKSSCSSVPGTPADTKDIGGETVKADLLRAAAYLSADENDDNSNTMPLTEALRIAGVLRALAGEVR